MRLKGSEVVPGGKQYQWPEGMNLGARWQLVGVCGSQKCTVPRACGSVRGRHAEKLV